MFNFLRILRQSPDGLLHDDPENRLPPVGDPAPAPSPVRDARPVCEFCECQLTARGEVLKFSDKAKRYREHDTAVEKLHAKIADLETELRETKAKLAALTPADGNSAGWQL